MNTPATWRGEGVGLRWVRADEVQHAAKRIVNIHKGA